MTVHCTPTTPPHLPTETQCLWYLGYYWPDFDQNLKIAFWDHLEQISTKKFGPKNFAKKILPPPKKNFAHKIFQQKKCQKQISTPKYFAKKLSPKRNVVKKNSPPKKLVKEKCFAKKNLHQKEFWNTKKILQKKFFCKSFLAGNKCQKKLFPEKRISQEKKISERKEIFGEKNFDEKTFHLKKNFANKIKLP